MAGQGWDGWAQSQDGREGLGWMGRSGIGEHGHRMAGKVWDGWAWSQDGRAGLGWQGRVATGWSSSVLSLSLSLHADPAGLTQPGAGVAAVPLPLCLPLCLP